MEFSSNLMARGHATSLVLVTAMAVALGSLAACDDGGGSNSLIHATVKVVSITQQGQCEDVGIKVTPITILPGAPQLSNGKEFVTRVKLAKGADNVSCTGEAATIPMSPGKWKFTGNLPSEVSSCERDIGAAGSLVINFKDGETACN